MVSGYDVLSTPYTFDSCFDLQWMIKNKAGSTASGRFPWTACLERKSSVLLYELGRQRHIDGAGLDQNGTLAHNQKEMGGCSATALLVLRRTVTGMANGGDDTLIAGNDGRPGFGPPGFPGFPGLYSHPSHSFRSPPLGSSAFRIADPNETHKPWFAE